MAELPRWVKSATVFAVVFTVVFVAVLAWQRQQERPRFVVDGARVEIRRASDGHWHWPGRINGHAVDFLIDTGASGSALPQPLAQQLGLRVVGALQSQTAAGVVRAEVVLADVELDGGVRIERMRMAAMPGLAAPLVGLDVLGRLAWRQEAGVLRIETPAVSR